MNSYPYGSFGLPKWKFSPHDTDFVPRRSGRGGRGINATGRGVVAETSYICGAKVRRPPRAGAIKRESRAIREQSRCCEFRHMMA